jgi:hypothetical protein
MTDDFDVEESCNGLVTGKHHDSRRTVDVRTGVYASITKLDLKKRSNPPLVGQWMN